jgi:hypothetical protein
MLGARVKTAPPDPVILLGACAPTGAQLPRGAAGLIRAAQDSGWQVRATYALAEVPAWRRRLVSVAKDGARWRDIPAEMLQTLCVRLVSPDGSARGYACWTNRRFDDAWLNEAGVLQRHGAGTILARVRSTTIGP